MIEGIRRKVADEYKVRVAYSGADMSKAPEIAAMIAQATKELGGVDILVNNAGIQYTAPVRDFPAEQWEVRNRPQRRAAGSGRDRAPRRAAALCRSRR